MPNSECRCPSCVKRNLKVSEQCLEVRYRVNRMLGIISYNVIYKSRDVISKLYKGYVRPVIEYCAQIWSPSLRKILTCW